jgi:hypothetical protein
MLFRDRDSILQFFSDIVGMKLSRQLLLLIFAFSYFSAQAQSDVALAKILEKFTFRETNTPSSTLFLHCDKTLYTNNETIWFAAYLQANRGAPIEKHHTLSVALLNNESKKINLSELYAMEAGLASGSIVLPDTIVPGNYQLLAYTNIVDKKGMPFEVFSIPLTIKSTVETKFNASIKLLDTAQIFKGPRRLSIRATGIPIQRNGKYPPAMINYYTAGGLVKTLQTNGDGEALFDIDANTLNLSNNNIYASVSYEKETKHLSLSLPVAEPKKVHLKFYPEGGNLAIGITSTIGFEATSAYGQPLSLMAMLLKDGKPIDTVETSSSGMGSFKLSPSAGSSYSLKIFKSNLTARDTVYTLPTTVSNLPVISLNNAAVSDTLSFLLKSAVPAKFGILIHNTHELLASFNVDANARGRNVKIALKDVPKGIASITVLDSLGNPLAERLFFARYTDGELLTAETDKPVYKPREKVTVKLRLKETEAGKEEGALVSVAAVQGNRIETAKFRDMESYTYLEHELGNLPLDPNGMPYRNRKYLEDLLLVKGWRRFVFDEKQWSAKVDTVGMYSSLEFSGHVTKDGKPLFRSVNISLLRDTVFNLLTTDTKGNFIIKPENMQLPSGKKLFASVDKPNKDAYGITIKDPYDNLEKNIDKAIGIPLDSSNLIEKSLIDLSLKQIETIQKLKTVEIKGNKDSLLSGIRGLDNRQSNDCGDYVCSGGVLNCPLPGHNANTRVPIKGRMYNYITAPPVGGGPLTSMSRTYYTGCIYEITNTKSKLTFLKGRFISKEFYNNNYKINPELDYQSTVFWSPFLQLSSSKETEVTFYTSDLKAPYRIIVQGLSEKQVVTGATTFKVE